jgi:hypothetical protein
MKNLQRPSKNQVVVTSIQPAYLLLKDAQKYCGMERDLFREVSREFGLPVYAIGPKKIWHKVTDLDKMMESFLAIKGKG